MDEQIDQNTYGPPDAGDETSTLLGGLERQRATFAWKISGLDQDNLTKTVASSDMTLGGLIKHLAFIEDFKFGTMLRGEELPPPWDTVDWEADEDWAWHSAANDEPEALYKLWQESVERSRESIRKVLSEGDLDVRVKYGFDDPSEAISLRRLLVDTLEEYARHVGHADLFREAIDGSVGEDAPGIVAPYQPPTQDS